jgi:hypothetical protein
MAKRKRKDPAAVRLGRKGGRARVKTTSKERLSEIGRAGAAARWAHRRAAGR